MPSRVAFLGPSGTFSEQALLADAELVGCEPVAKETIAAVVEALVSGDVDAALVPIDNSIGGAVAATAEALAAADGLVIRRHLTLDVHLDLMALPGTDAESIETVVTFGHAASQCQRFLSHNLPGAAVQVVSSTAEAAKRVAEEGSHKLAAVASARAAEIYGLEILAPAIEDEPDNKTRFALLQRA